VRDGWSEEEKQAYRLADNELAGRSSWDPDLLRNELRDLKFNGFDLELIGFEPDRLEVILAGLGSSGLTDPGPTRLESGQACCQLLIPQSQSLRRHLPSVSRCRSQTARIFAEDVVQLR
jgi:hypothetical protein